MNEGAWDFRKCLAASAVLHALFFLIAHGLPSFTLPPPVEVEITSPFLGTGPARLAPPKAKIEGIKGIPLPAQKAEAQKPVETKPPEPPKDWTTKTVEVPKVEKPQPPPQAPGAVPEGTQSAPSPGGVTGGAGISPLLGGIDGHSPYGTPNGTGDGGAPLTAFPSLLNRDELAAILRKYYPESERRAGHEGDVLLKVHIGVDGLVTVSDILHADSPAFGTAAQKVAVLMRFSPATNAAGPVPVSIRVPINFRLKD